jgi:hypothetical protein
VIKCGDFSVGPVIGVLVEPRIALAIRQRHTAVGRGAATAELGRDTIGSDLALRPVSVALVISSIRAIVFVHGVLLQFG